MQFYRRNGSQMSPCIASKVTHALNMPNRYTGNSSKKCSINYWEEACEIIGSHYNLNNDDICNAKRKFNEYIN